VLRPPPTHVLATLRRDGSPRVSGSEIACLGSDLSFGSMPNAVKALDLQRDGRCALHAHPSSDGDAKVAGVAVEVTGEAKSAYLTGDESPGEPRLPP
jgi:Pyridoxamine 5'-phosphate oxidase